jgi:phosphatidate cytidylyltransferase
MSRQEIAQRLAAAAAIAMALGAVWIVAAGRSGAFRGRRIGVAYVVEPLVILAILVPAYLGGLAFAAAVATLGAVSALELHRALRAARARPMRWIAGYLYLVFGSAGLLALGRGDAGFGRVAFCFCLVEIADSLAYLAGATLGGWRPFARLSPRKTLAGSLAGVLGALALAPLFGFALPGASLVELLAAGALIGVAGLSGDLFASSFKRAAAIKDYGSWVPSHGGLLDVYDSLLFTAPLFLAYLQLRNGTA